MPPIFAISSNITTSIGLTTESVWAADSTGKIGIRRFEDDKLSHSPFWASRINPDQWSFIRDNFDDVDNYSPFEQMAIYSVKDAIYRCEQAIDLSRTVLILSSTKGNIEWLGKEPDERNLLTTSAKIIAEAIGINALPIVVSHACVSGVIALQYGQRLIESGRYEQAIVVGADRFTRFVLNGFQSFQAIADEPCRPFDAARKGINLGEAAATIILSRNADDKDAVRLFSGATSNDANHISGPSRTGAELAMAITKTLDEADVKPEDVGMISAHGTATLYNDEMESKAFAHAGLLQSAVHSMKGYVGHTLGAAGVLESAMIIESIKRQQLIPSAGYETSGVPETLNITTQLQHAPLKYVLKTASGFGGCNATILFGK